METIIIDMVKNNLGVSTPIDMIKYMVTVVEKIPNMTGKEKKTFIIEIAKTICSGKDGIFGTKDDLFSPIMVHGLEALLNSGLIDDVIDLAHLAVIPNNYPILRFIIRKIYSYLKRD